MIEIAVADIRDLREIPVSARPLLSVRTREKLGWNAKTALESGMAEILLIRMLRDIPAGQAGNPDGTGPAALPLRIAEHGDGKPYLADFPGLHYNLSHSGGLAVCALATENVGVDVQVWMPERIHLAQKICTAEEFAVYREVDDPVRAFFDLWTEKEAYLKYLGTGIRRRMNSFSVTGPSEAGPQGRPAGVPAGGSCSVPVRDPREPSSCARVLRFALAAGFSAAVCADGAQTAAVTSVYTDHPGDFEAAVPVRPLSELFRQLDPGTAESPFPLR